MAAVEMWTGPEWTPERPTLRVITSAVAASPTRSQVRAAREAMRRRRRRTLLVTAVVAAGVMLAWPGHAFGGVNGVGLSTDLASSSALSAGSVYVVQPGDTLMSIARLVNPVTPAAAERVLVKELHSDAVVTGEHVLIP